MDKKLLDSLNNLSLALEDIAEILAKKQSTSSTGAALESGDFSKDLKNISVSIKSIKADTQEILKGQKTILEMSKKKSAGKTPMEEAGGDKKQESNIKKGVGTILLIAVAVLAIGLAFKMVGKIDFLSVVGLGIAIVIIAIAFEKVAKINMTLKQAAIASLAMVMMSIAVMMSSWALGMIKPIGIAQAITGILIAGLFTVISFGLPKIVKAIDSIKNPIKTGAYLVLILPAMGLSIAMASWALSMIKPIGLGQAITGILIAGMFTVLAFGLPKIVKALDKVKNPVKMALLIPLLLPLMAGAIAAASWVLSLVKPISFGQAITAILIAALFTVLSFGIEKIVKALGKMKWSDVAKLPVFFTLIAGAIAASAFIFAKAAPYFNEITFMMMLKVLVLGVAMGAVLVIVAFAMKIMGTLKWGDVVKVPALFTLLALAIAAAAFIMFKASAYINGITFMTMLKLLVFSVVLAIAIVVLAIAMKIVNLLGSVGSYIKGGIAVLIIATTIMASSHILSMGKYGKYPDWRWSLGVGLSLGAFGVAMALLGGIAMSGVGALAILAGGAMVLLVAGTIVATSHILGMGKYSKFPSLEWSGSVALSMGAFAAGMVLLGGLIIATFGIGGLMLAAGSEAVLVVAQTIVDTSFILSKGKYTGGPTKDWAEGISIALGAFSPVYSMLMANSILSLFGGGGAGPEEFSTAIRTVSQGIVDAANFFADPKVSASFKGGPPASWAAGVGAAIGAFAPVYQVLAANSGWMSSGVSVDDMKTAIMTISQGIVDAAIFFASNTAPFDEGKYPSESWGKGVGAALNAFAPVFKALHEDSGFWTSGDEVIQNMVSGVSSISWSIVDSALAFSSVDENSWKSYPTTSWASGVSSAVESYVGVVDSVEGLYFLQMFKLSSVVSQIVNIAEKFHKSQKFFNFKIDENFFGKISKNVLDYARLAKDLDKMLTITEKKTISLGAFGDLNFTTKRNADISTVNKVVSQLVMTAGILYKNRNLFSTKIDPNYMKNVSSNVLDYALLAKKLALVNKDSGVMNEIFGLDPISRAAKGMVKIASAYDKLAKSINSFGSALGRLDPIKVLSFTRLTGNIAMLSALDSTMFSNMMTVLERRTGVFANMLKMQESGVKRPTVGMGSSGVRSKKDGDDSSGPKDRKGETQLSKLDEVIRLLSKISTEVDGLDTYLQAKNKSGGSLPPS